MAARVAGVIVLTRLSIPRSQGRSRDGPLVSGVPLLTIETGNASDPHRVRRLELQAVEDRGLRRSAAARVARPVRGAVLDGGGERDVLPAAAREHRGDVGR